MLGELSVAIATTEEQIQQLHEERELYVMANDEILPEFVFQKKLKEFDDKIEALKEELASLYTEKSEVIEMEAADLDKNLPPAPDAFEEEFNELAQVEGVKKQGFDYE